MKLVFATNNAHKLQEVREILAGAVAPDIEILSLADIDCHEEIPETGATLEENALQKARWVASRYGLDCFADDTGLEVDALGGEPGVMSARYAQANGRGKSHDSRANSRLLLERMEGMTDRTARFRTAVAIILGDKEHLLEGKVEGSIALSPAGDEGFGYDPIFIPQGHSRTFAQMTAEEKNSLSHRGRAMQSLRALLSSLDEIPSSPQTSDNKPASR